MSVTVYPRLAELLEEHHLTLAELEGRIATQFGSAVDTQGLVRLAESTPVRQADLELAGAAAAVLGVGLDDLFTVAALPGPDEAGLQILDPDDSRHLVDLLDRKESLTPDELHRLEILLGRYGRLHHRGRR